MASGMELEPTQVVFASRTDKLTVFCNKYDVVDAKELNCCKSLLPKNRSDFGQQLG
jgi:hypothetical protein